ncbi:hypothetical protein HMPREF1982_01574 [Clostridiales bacterium oral taxon 876 str. F0540]|nr:hypothetical protein HMPREF1982_01574 [Clostridiales bacterium oral taxon 876 str. F0540]
MEDRRRNDNDGFGIGHFITRVIVSAIVLAIVAFLTPGFTINGIWTLLIAAVVIAGLDYLIQKFTGFNASPFGRGLTGFIVSAAIIYLTSYIVSGFRVGIISALIAALLIGVIDSFLPSGKKVM